MQRKNFLIITAMLTVAVLFSLNRHGFAQQEPISKDPIGTKLPKAIHIQAQAMGESTQLGQSFVVNLIIE